MLQSRTRAGELRNSHAGGLYNKIISERLDLSKVAHRGTTQCPGTSPAPLRWVGEVRSGNHSTRSFAHRQAETRRER